MLAFLGLPAGAAARALPAADDTPPIVTYTIDGIVGAHNWYRGSTHGNNIVVHWSVSDPESGILSTTGCEPAIQIPGPNTGTTRTCSATSDGGTTTVTTKQLKIDATAPTNLQANPQRGADHNGWYNHAVGIAWGGTDATSGIDTCTTRTYSGPDVRNGSASGTCRDMAGNTSTALAFRLSYDATRPNASSATPARGTDHNGWYNHAVGITWRGSDLKSGIASCTSLTYSGPDVANRNAIGTCTDVAGNTSTALTFRLSYDATRPTASSAIPARGTDHNGWYNHAVGITWRGSDAMSGIASCTSLTYSGPDTAGTDLTGVCTDRAGNTAGPLRFALSYDATPPALKRLFSRAMDDRVTLRWRLAGAKALKIMRSPGVRKAAASLLYNGSGSRFTDRRVQNYVKYRYTLTAEDAAGNTARRSTVARPMPVLFAPRPHARVRPYSSPLFGWRPVQGARYYNIQLWLKGHALGAWWPVKPWLKLPSQWRFRGTSHRLGPGTYTWYVWPGRGARRAGKYGPLLGKSTFVAR